MRAFFLAPFLYVLCVFSLFAQVNGDPCLFTYQHVEGTGELVPDQSKREEVEESTRIIRRISNAVGRFRIDVFSVPGMNNACAARPGRLEVVYYDKDWLNRYADGNDWIVLGVLAHEVGHLINNHRPDSLSAWQREYEADFFVGRAVAILGGKVEDAKTAVSKQPVDASAEYPSRFLREAAVVEGFLSSDPAKGPNIDLRVPVQIAYTYNASTIGYVADGTSFDENIADYQGGAPIDASDIIAQSHSVSVRLGRENDMALLSAFGVSKGKVCAKHLYLQIRDGHNITIEPVATQPGWATGEYYGITYGRKRDLFNVIGIRNEDFEFVFDPSAPRTGRSRNPTFKVTDSIAKGAKGIYVKNAGCH